jgi:hypothetical protein
VEKSYLLSLDLLGVRVVGLRDIRVRCEVLFVHGLQNLLLDLDVLEEPLVLLVLKVIHDRDHGRVVLENELHRI